MTSATAGFPTAGFQPWLIKVLGCWNGNVHMSYICALPHILQTFTAVLARTNVSQHPARNLDEQQ